MFVFSYFGGDRVVSGRVQFPVRLGSCTGESGFVVDFLALVYYMQK